MNRETIEIKTISGKTLAIKTYLTAREMQAINAVLVGDKTSDVDSKVTLPLSAALEWKKNILSNAIVSIEGSEENPIEQVLDLPNDEYQDIKTKVFTQLKINLTSAK